MTDIEPSLSKTRSDEIPFSKIVDFYRNIVESDLNTTNNDEYYLNLTDFLNTIFNAATYQTEDTISTTLTSLASLPRNLVLDDEPESTKGNLMNKLLNQWCI